MKAFPLISVVAIAAIAAASVPGARTGTPPDHEVVRLQAHFDTVDGELRRADVSHLTPDQRATRARMIGWLREYREAASFPRNDRFRGRFVPFFRDSRGVLCAMAYLIARSGHGEFVDRIARTRNNAYIRELAADAALTAWLTAAGLSVAEAGRIQPMYQFPENNSVDQGFQNRSVAMGIGSLVTTGMNLAESGRGWAWAGLIAGTASLAAGVEYANEGDSKTQEIALANMVVGAVALASGLKGFRATSTDERSSGMHLMPAVFPAGGEPHVGFAFAAAF